MEEWTVLAEKWRGVIKEFEISSVLQKQSQKYHVIYIYIYFPLVHSHQEPAGSETLKPDLSSYWSAEHQWPLRNCTLLNLAGKGSQGPCQALPHMYQPGIIHCPNYPSPVNVCSPGLLLFTRGFQFQVARFSCWLGTHKVSRSQNCVQKVLEARPGIQVHKVERKKLWC